MAWYVFRITPPGTVNNPTDYLRVPNRPISTGCTNLRGIQTSDNGFGFPILSNSILGEIATALNNQQESTNVVLRGI